MYCGKCGSKLDETTGRCPVCDAVPINEPVQAKTQKKSHTAVWMTLIIAILVIAFAVAGYFVWKHFTQEDTNDKINRTVGTLYTDTINSKLANDLGYLSENYKKRGAQGLISAKELDFDGDGKKEYVSVYAKNTGGSCGYYVSGYTYNEEKVKKYAENQTSQQKPAESAELPAEETSPIEETQDLFFEEPEASESNFDMAAYEVTVSDKSYIFIERIDYSQGCSYVCRVYTMENGKLKEVANVFEPSISSTGECIVCTSAPWTDKSVDNADLDSEVAATWEEQKEHYADKDSVVLYYDAGDDGDYRYTTYYASKEEAVLDLFKKFDLKKENYVISDTQTPAKKMLDIDENAVTMIYRYTYFGESDAGSEAQGEFIFKDYTDIAGVIGKQPEKKSTEDVDLKKQIDAAVAFENEFYKPENWDKDEFITDKDANGNEVTFHLYKAGNVKTWDQLREYFGQYYTAKAFDDSFKYEYKETDKGLYVCVPGFDGGEGHEILIYEKTSDTEYTITRRVYPSIFTGGTGQAYDSEYHMIYQGGKWVFDTMLPFDLTYFALIKKGDKQGEDRMKQFDAYLKILVEANRKNYGNEAYGEYLYYDMDKDGVGELITVTGTYEKDKEFSYYGFDGKDSYLIESKGGTHASFYVNKSGALFCGGYWKEYLTLFEVTLSGKSIEQKEIIREPLDDTNRTRFEQEYTQAPMAKFEQDFGLFDAIFEIETDSAQ